MSQQIVCDSCGGDVYIRTKLKKGEFLKLLMGTVGVVRVSFSVQLNAIADTTEEKDLCNSCIAKALVNALSQEGS